MHAYGKTTSHASLVKARSLTPTENEIDCSKTFRPKAKESRAPKPGCSIHLNMHAGEGLTTMIRLRGRIQGTDLLGDGLTASAHSHSRQGCASLLQDAPQCLHDHQAEIYHQIVKSSLSCHPRFDDQSATTQPHYQRLHLPWQQQGQMQNLTVILVTAVMAIFETQVWEAPDCYQSRLGLAPRWVFEVASWCATLIENRFETVAKMSQLGGEAYI